MQRAVRSLHLHKLPGVEGVEEVDVTRGAVEDVKGQLLRAGQQVHSSRLLVRVVAVFELERRPDAFGGPEERPGGRGRTRWRWVQRRPERRPESMENLGPQPCVRQERMRGYARQLREGRRSTAVRCTHNVCDQSTQACSCE